MKTKQTAITMAIGLMAAGWLLPGPARAQPQDTEKRLYCWNENGQRICGDTLPVDAVDEARSVFNAETGTQTGQVARALTDEERAAKEAADAKAARLAEAQAERERQEQAMVASYANESELRHTYQTRIDLLDATIKGSTLSMGNLRQRLLDLLLRAGEQELAGRPVPKNLAASIASQHVALLQQQSVLDNQHAEQRDLHAQLDRTLTRYRELKTATTAEATDG